MDAIKQVIDQLNGIIWNWPPALPLLVVLLLGTGIFLTLRLGFINFRGFGHAIRVTRGVYDDPDHPGDISHFQALTTALSATVGIGNIGGVATAIHYGGPGALFWMWLTAIFGMTTKFVECTLGIAFRRENADGTVSGGPMYYMERALKIKPMALFFALCAVISSFGSGNAVQAFTMADQFRSQFGLPTWLTGGAASLLVALVILGGIKRIGNFTSRIVPFMAGLYVLTAIGVLLINAGQIPAAFAAIFEGAISPTAAVGGFAGASLVFTLTWGVKRGLFSNEAGQGSAPIAHAAAKTDEPVREGAVALLGPFIDTLTICTITGLVIVTTGVWQEKQPDSVPLKAQSGITLVAQRCTPRTNGKLTEDCAMKAGSRLSIREGKVEGASFMLNHSVVDAPRLVNGSDATATPITSGTVVVDAHSRPTVLGPGGKPMAAWLRGAALQNGSPLTSRAFDRGLAPLLPEGLPLGSWMVTIAVFLFALSTAIGWSYYGDRSAQYLFGQGAVLPYKLVFVVMHFFGAIFSLEVVWGFGDAALGTMSLPNLIAIVALSGTVARMSKEYFSRDHVPFGEMNKKDRS